GAAASLCRAHRVSVGRVRGDPAKNARGGIVDGHADRCAFVRADMVELWTGVYRHNYTCVGGFSAAHRPSRLGRVRYMGRPAQRRTDAVGASVRFPMALAGPRHDQTTPGRGAVVARRCRNRDSGLSGAAACTHGWLDWAGYSDPRGI